MTCLVPRLSYCCFSLNVWTFTGCQLSVKDRFSSYVSFKICVSILIFCFDDLSIGVSGVLKSPTIIVLLSISPFMSVSVCLMYWGAPMLGASVQSLNRAWLFATPWITALQASLSITNSWSSLRLTSIESVMPSSHLILCRPLLLLPPIPPRIRVFSNESTLHMRWPKYWTFSFNIIPSKEIPGLISFRMDWLDLLAVQGTFKSLLQYLSSN